MLALDSSQLQASLSADSVVLPRVRQTKTETTRSNSVSLIEKTTWFFHITERKLSMRNLLRKNSHPLDLQSLPKNINLIVVGDAHIGKTSLLTSYAGNSFPSRYLPTVLDHYEVSLSVSEQELQLNLWDTAGREEYCGLRTISHTLGDVFLLCFSVNDPDSLKNVQKKWLPDVKEHNPTVPIILVGLKTDLRKSPKKNSVSTAEAKKLSKKLKAVNYLECSAKTANNVKELFDEAILTALKYKQSKTSSPR